ncbi:MAG: S46 family peptidase [Archangium gephyra]|uniref:Dipeptidyl-peptidase n=1 Tax=Archangium gephyra TaxID=48 RepID=A0A2W5TKT0_9BACT|nr:MAG: S46 family peptidase [Archangium gephyra]
MRKYLSLAAASALCASGAFADEGMWTYNNFPAARVKAKYGFEPGKDWLDHLRLASVRIAGGCSASVVSPSGLVMTNHHCARECIENLSGLMKKDFNRDGFFAKTEKDEANCPGMELNQLAEITDVTKRVQDATKGVADDKFAEAQKGAIAAIEKECQTGDEFRCEVISLYRGGRYDLYKYQRFSDIRLVFAPEDGIAFFGGDPDNFTFPRYDLDVSFVRIYGKDGKPAKLEHYLRWSDGTIKEGDATFVSGNPGGTSRTLTVAQLDDDRDFRLPATLFRLAELRGYVTEYQNRGKEQKRHSNDLLFGVENGFKALKGRHAALADKAFYGQLVKNEADFRSRVKAKAELEKQYGGVWTNIEGLVKLQQAYRKEYNALERGPTSELFGLARALLRYGDEAGKPNAERLREYTDSRLPQFKARVLANTPIYDEFEIATLTYSLTKIREDLGADHPFIKRVFGNKSPAEIAANAVKGSKLKDIKTDKAGNATGGFRKELFDGGKAKIDASKDPMIELARAFDPDARAIRKKYETDVEGPMKKQQELLAKARFAVYGDSIYPDATFTLRLSYGAVEGYNEGTARIQPFSKIAGAFDRHTGADPYALPKTWLNAKSKLNLETPFNFVTSNDIIGGNSGSPMVNVKGEVVGLVFDGNIQSLGGDYGFDKEVNRTVAVHSAALIEALDKVYGARRIVDELKPAK